MRRPLWLAGRWIVYMVVAAGLAALLALVAARLYLRDERLTATVHRMLNSNLHGEFDVQEVQWLWPNGVAVRGLTARAPGRTQPTVTVDEISLRVGVVNLLARTVDVHTSHIAGLEIRESLLELGSLESGSLAQIFRGIKPTDPDQPATELGWRFQLRNLQVDANVYLSILKDAASLDLTDLQSTVSATWHDGEIELHTKKLTTGIRLAHPAALPGKPLRGELSLRDIRLSQPNGGPLSLGAESVHFANPATQLTATATVLFPSEVDETRWEASGTASMDIEEILATALAPDALPKGLRPRGAVQVRFISSGQPMQSSTFDINIAGDDLEFVGVPIREISATLELAHPHLTAHRVVIRLAEDGTIQGRGTLNLETTAHEVHANLENLPLARLLSPWLADVPLPELADGSVQARGPSLTLLHSTIATDLVLRRLPEEIPAVLDEPLRIQGEGTLQESTLQVQQLVAQIEGLRASAEGRVSWHNSGTVELLTEVVADNLTPWLQAFDLPLRARQAGVAARLSGSLAAITVTGTAFAEGVASSPVPNFDVHDMSVTIPFQYVDNTVHIRQARASFAGGEVHADGDILLPVAQEPYSVNARVEIENIALEAVTALDLAGRAHANLMLVGNHFDPRIGGSVRVADLRIAQAIFTRATALLRTQDNTIFVDDVLLDMQQAGHIAASATFHPQTTALTTEMEAEAIPLDQLFGLLPEETHETLASLQPFAVLDARLRASGPIDEPIYHAAWKLSDLRLRDTDIGAMVGTVRGGLQGAIFNIEQQGPLGAVHLDAAMDFEELAVRAELRAQRLSLEHINAAFLQLEPSLSGVASVGLDIDGTLPFPQLSGHVSLRNFSVNDVVVAPQTVFLSLQSPDTQTYDIVVRAGPTQLLQARIDTQPEISVALHGSFQQFPVHHWLPVLAQNDVQLVLTAGYSAHFASREDFAVQAQIGQLVLATPTDRLVSDMPTSFLLQPRGWQLEPLRLHGRRGMLEFSGRQEDRHLDVSAAGLLDMSLITAFVPAITQASGSVQLRFAMLGDMDAPSISGSIELLEAISLRPRGMPREISVDSGRVAFRQQDLSIDRIIGRYGPGRFMATGSIALDGFLPAAYDMRIIGEALTLNTAELVLEANTQLRLTGQRRFPMIEGQVEIVRGRYIREFVLRNFNFIAREVVIDEPIEARLPWLTEVDLNLRAFTAGPVEVRVDATALAMQVDLEGNVQVSGSAAAPVVEGRVQATGGTLGFPQAQLDIVRASVDFAPEDQEIDVRAEGDVVPGALIIQDTFLTYFVNLTLRGNLEQMALEVSSAPPLSELEILSLLVTGRAALPDLVGATQDERSQLDAALSFAGSQLAAPLSRFVEGQLERVLNLELDIGAELTREAAIVTAAKTIAPRLRIEGAFQQGLGDTMSAARARAMWSLSDRIYLQGETQTGIGADGLQTTARGMDRTKLDLKLRIFGEP